MIGDQVSVKKGKITYFLWVGALTVIATTALATPAAPSFGSAFWQHWGDGQAELAGYNLQLKRYGEPRTGQALTIFVTETFEHQRHVKVDRKTEGPQYPVMKLNLIRDFQTGIYDYNTMTSVFISLENAAGLASGTPSKISFSSQEWCGHVYHQVLFEPDQVQETVHSYFDGEADQSRTLSIPTQTLSEDALWHWARGLAGPILKPGESTTLPLLSSLTRSRLDHESLSLSRVTLSRDTQRKQITLNQRTFEVEVLVAAIEGGPRWSFEVDTEPPHLIARWSNDRGESAALLGSKRMAYWKLNGPEGRSALKDLGLKPLP